MRTQILVAVCLGGVLPGFAQNAPASPSQSLPKDPRAILAAAALFYDFSDPALKPWHIKATYQLYDDKGNPAEQGTFEYWWASPKIYRSSWLRPGATHTDWHTADGKHAYLSTGGGLSFFEYKLQSALFSPLPESADLDPAKIRLDRQEVKMGDVKFPCIEVIPLMPQHGQVQAVPLGLFPTYCFDPELPALRVSYSFGTVAMNFNRIVKVQGRFLPREVGFYEGKQQILSADVQTIEGIPSNDPALTPAATAIFPNVEKVPISAGVAVGMLVKKQVPVYPQDAKDSRVSGTVVLQATIGGDGRVHDLHVVSAPWPSLAASSLWAVSHWEYKPYMLNGEPVEVETTVNVIFSLGQ
jgi:TonB family protein